MIKSLVPWDGNKDREYDTIKIHFPNMDDINTIVEPFGGSFSIIRHLVTQYPDKRYIVNDIDTKLINLYKDMQNDYTYEQIITELKALDIKDKTEYNTYKKTRYKQLIFIYIKMLHFISWTV